MSGHLIWEPGDEREMTILAAALEPGDVLIVDDELATVVAWPRPAGLGWLAINCVTHSEDAVESVTNGEEWVWRTHPDAELKILRVGVS